ncbi:MAG: hypothetical protein ACE5HT_02775 [Gemmatimonadales bacterium]
MNETAEKPRYVAPQIRVMDEEEVLKTFQVTSAAGAWWVVGVGGSG